MSLVTPVVMCVGVSPTTGIGSAPSTSTNITQDVQAHQKLLVIWRTMGDSGVYGTSDGILSIISRLIVR